MEISFLLIQWTSVKARHFIKLMQTSWKTNIALKRPAFWHLYWLLWLYLQSINVQLSVLFSLITGYSVWYKVYKLLQNLRNCITQTFCLIIPDCLVFVLGGGPSFVMTAVLLWPNVPCSCCLTGIRRIWHCWGFKFRLLFPLMLEFGNKPEQK